jgi:putative membrane protein
MAIAQASSPSAGTNAAASSPRAASLAAADQAFVRDAAESGKAEVQASQLALSKAHDQRVKDFARQMVEDHTQANTKLERLAAAKGIALPAQPGAADQNALRTLTNESGAAFDQRYMNEYGLKAHRSAVEKFRKEAQSGQDGDVKAFAQETLPTLETHLQHATALAKPGSAR